MKTTLLLLSTLIGMSLTTAAYGWRETGHWVVCEIAYRQIADTPAGAALRAITGDQDYARQCTWPDMVRKSPEWKHTYDWHFINLDDGNYLTPQLFSKTGDAMQAIMMARALLKSSAPTAKKLQYLRFLGHMTGDLHQPLHAGHKSDLGGNNITLKWFGQAKFPALEILRFMDPDPACPANRFRDASGQCKACPNGDGHKVDTFTGECVELKTSMKEHNLHYVWDHHLIQRFKEQENIMPEGSGDSPEAHRAYATWLLAQATPAQIAAWKSKPLFDWTRESLRARGGAYDVEPGASLGENYYDAHIGHVHERLTAAGVRLGALLTEIFSGTSSLGEEFLRIKHDEQHAHLCHLATAAGADEPFVCEAAL